MDYQEFRQNNLKNSFKGNWHIFYRLGGERTTDNNIWGTLVKNNIIYPAVIESKAKILNNYVVIKLSSKGYVKNDKIYEKGKILSKSLESEGFYRLTVKGLNEKEVYDFYLGKFIKGKIEKKRLLRVKRLEVLDKYKLSYEKLCFMKRGGILKVAKLKKISFPKFMVINNTRPKYVNYKCIKTYVLREFLAKKLNLINKTIRIFLCTF